MLALATILAASPLVTAFGITSSASPLANWTLLNDTDFDTKLPGKPYSDFPVKSAVDCADLCEKLPSCIATSWNGPSSQYANLYCNFHCSSAHPHKDKGEIGIVVRPGMADTCGVPPSPPSPPSPGPSPTPTPTPVPPGTNWTLLTDTDFDTSLPGRPYSDGPVHNAGECADLCEKLPNCVATSWNGPGSHYPNRYCNFHCSSAHPHSSTGEIGIIVRPGMPDTCDAPPPGPAQPPYADWQAQFASGDLLYSDSLAHLMPSVGNGYLATHPLHVDAEQSGTLYVAGVFDGFAVPFGSGAPQRARVPAYRVIVSPDVGAGIDDGGYALDLARAILIHRFNVSGARLECRHYAHMTRRHVLVHEVDVDNSAGATAVTITFAVAKGDESQEISFAPKPAGSEVYSIVGRAHRAETPMLNSTEVGLAANIPPPNVSVAAGERRVLCFVTAIATSLDSPDPAAAAIAELRAALSDATSLLTSHSAAWAQRWADGHVEVFGSLPLAQAVNASLYYILSSIRSDWPQGLSPGGLATNGYYGWSFWDTETWMLPNLLLLQPDEARAILQYRINREDGARAKAHANGCVGLMFPWVTAYSGYDVSPNPWGQYEQHITSDIAFAASQYWYATGDKNFLRSSIEPLLRGVADFWASRVAAGNDGKYHINHVMPPDEYHKNINDSVFTNWGAVFSLHAALEAAQEVGRSPSANWSHIAGLIDIPYDTEKQYHPEFKGYLNGTGVKQADVILLRFPFMFNMTSMVRKNDLDMYAPVTDPSGPAMTWAMFAIGWLEAGNASKANANFLRGYSNIVEPFKVWTETPGGGGTLNFITGAGGFLQSVLYGYGGLRLHHDALHIDPPAPPDGVTSLRLAGVHYRGSKLDIHVSLANISISILSAEPGAPALFLMVPAGEAISLRVGGKPVSQPRCVTGEDRYSIRTSNRHRADTFYDELTFV